MAPSNKRKAAAVEKYECFSCATDKPAKQFPDYNPSPDCDHLINTCRSCLKKWVESRIEGANFTVKPAEGDEAKEVWGIACPQCSKGVMRAVNVELAVSKKVFERFDELGRKHIADSTPNWRWCLNSECRAGQIHVPNVIQPESETQEPPAKRRKCSFNPFKKADVPAPQMDSLDIMTCNSCSARTCVPCDRPLHEGETCAAYRARVKDRLEEEDKAIQAIRKLSRPCPGCSRNIQKNGGCPNMRCSQCQINFCWKCLGVFNQRGFCKCYQEPGQQNQSGRS